MAERMRTPEARDVAFVRVPGQGPEICFLPGLRSDMQGTKALHLEAWAKARGRAFLRLDYSGHGESSGAFEDGCVGDWMRDASAVIFAERGPKVLVGSSMGGWVALLIARARLEEVAGLVLIAPAPDFTSELAPWPAYTAEQKLELRRDGRITLPNPYGDEPTVLTRRLIEDGAAQQVLGRPLTLPMPVRMLHGTLDADVPPAVSEAVLDQAGGADIALTLLKGADHRFSSPLALSLVERALEEVLERTALSEK